MPRLCVILTLVFLHGNPTWAAPANSVSLELVGGRPVINDVYVNDQGPFRFLLDTGAQTNQIDAKAGLRAGLTPRSRVYLDTAAGTVLVPAAPGGRLRLAGASRDDQEFLLTDLAAVRKMDPSIMGVVGQEFLSHFDYQLDLRGKRLRIGIEPEAGERIPFTVHKGAMVVATSEGRLVVDSGSEALILFGSPTHVGGSNAGMWTASGFQPVARGDSADLQIGSRRFRIRDQFLAPAYDQEVQGLMPVALFHSVSVFNSGRYLVIR